MIIMYSVDNGATESVANSSFDLILRKTKIKMTRKLVAATNLNWSAGKD